MAPYHEKPSFKEARRQIAVYFLRGFFVSGAHWNDKNRPFLYLKRATAGKIKMDLTGNRK